MIDPIQPNDDAFVDQLRSMVPTIVPNVSQTFYRAGWGAAMQEKNAESFQPVVMQRRPSFSWGLLSGLAAGVVLLLSIQSIGTVWNSGKTDQVVATRVFENKPNEIAENGHEMNQNNLAVAVEKSDDSMHRLVVAVNSRWQAQGFIQQREELLDDLIGNPNRNRGSRLALHFGEPNPVDEIALERNSVFPNRLIDEEIKQLLKSENRILGVQ